MPLLVYPFFYFQLTNKFYHNMRYYIDLQLFPCIDFFKILKREINMQINIYERFRKMSFHNRYVVAGANGIVNLTIPIRGGREQKRLITDVEIDDTSDWQKKHWRTLVSGYAKAPFFDYYSEEIKALIFNEEKSLANFNIFILEKLLNWLNINIVNYNSSSEQAFSREFHNTLLPRNFQKNNLDWKPKYAQVFEDRIGFQPNLSVIDLLFNVGPASSGLLISGRV